MTLSERIIKLVALEPGHTAWSIAKTLTSDPHASAATISSLLCRMAGDGRLRRVKLRIGGRISWTYYPERNYAKR